MKSSCVKLNNTKSLVEGLTTSAVGKLQCKLCNIKMKAAGVFYSLFFTMNHELPADESVNELIERTGIVSHRSARRLSSFVQDSNMSAKRNKMLHLT